MSSPLVTVERAAARVPEGAGGIEVTYRESDVVHTIDPANLPVAAEWLAATLPRHG